MANYDRTLIRYVINQVFKTIDNDSLQRAGAWASGNGGIARMLP